MAWSTPSTRATGYVVTNTNWNELVDDLTYLKGQGAQVALEDSLLVPKSGAVAIVAHRTDAGAALMALYEGRRNTAAKWWLGLDASDRFVVLNAAGNTANLTITDAGAVTTRAGLTITTGSLTVSAGGASFAGNVTQSVGTVNVGAITAPSVTVAYAAVKSTSSAVRLDVEGSERPIESLVAIPAGVARTNAYGMILKTPTLGAGASITNGYGLYVEAQNVASTSYAIWTNGGRVLLAGYTRITNSGLEVGTATGADLGAGTINVQVGVYLNNTAYTNPDYALEHWATGRIDRYSDRPGAAEYPGLQPLVEVERFIREHWHLPRINRETSDIFERADMVLEKIEEITLYLIDHERRLAALESRT